MALIRGSMISPDGRTVYATCEHHKVNMPARPDHLKLLDQMRSELRSGRLKNLDEQVEKKASAQPKL